ncbi:mitochondrial 54S ribosomal protein uL3m [Ascoidea rubescens DSM 1968]|uniref:Large ribosomal subunit protein uL3m n=1 Tax=Ascoidea rubescens DSM 1968 TaxID=1344418 RepID=A0A1D2VCB7_9ASCO|nr:translation protein [Ascoidea rubescens DSM 1968]ODV59202.1 translation protein [Ascoidea rubescens DSM 1968]
MMNISIWRPLLLNSKSAPVISTFIRHGASLTAIGAVDNTPPRNEVRLPEHSAERARLRKLLPLRPGLIGVKKGMVPFFTETGERIGCTLLEINAVEVLHNKTAKVDGYYAVQLGYGIQKVKKVTRQLLGHCSKAGVSPKMKICEFQVLNEKGLVPVGSELKADHFKKGDFVDLIGITRGKGFQGVMKRFGFGGGGASHGVSKAHRTGGSYGQCQDPGRVLPGKKMPGRMGGNQRTVRNSQVVEVNAERGYILVKGGVPGSDGGYIKIRDSIKELSNKKNYKTNYPHMV